MSLMNGISTVTLKVYLKAYQINEGKEENSMIRKSYSMSLNNIFYLNDEMKGLSSP